MRTPEDEQFLRDLERVWSPLDLVLETGVATKPVKSHQANLEVMCPFHDDSGYNCAVHKERGVYRCLHGSCDNRGSLYKLLARLWGYEYPREFPQIVRRIADRYGMKPPRRHRNDMTPEERVQAALSLFVHVARQHLLGPEGDGARDYLHRRGLTDESIERFGLGYWPDHARLPCVKEPTDSCQVLVSDLVEARLLVEEGKEERKHLRPWFRDRIIIPVREKGQILNLQGRVPFNAPKGQKKVINYLNLQHTRRAPWGLQLLGQEEEVCLVEGPFDAMLSIQAGVPAVALLGCQTEPGWIARLPRGRVYVVAGDGDAAGGALADRIGRDLMQRGDPVEVATLPAGWDPADLVAAQTREGSPTGWRELVSEAIPLPVWLAKRIPEPHRADPWKLEQALAPILSLLLDHRSPGYYQKVVPQLAAQVGLPALQLLDQLDLKQETFKEAAL